MKRFLYLLCVLTFCLALTPATALAAEGAPNYLFVGNQNVKSSEDTTYWATNDIGELELVEGASDTSNNWSVKYDPNTAILTLKNATIKTTHNDSRGAVIYAQSVGSRAVSLTIELEGRNTIDSGSCGIYVNAEMSNDSYGTDASLTITGKGSLDVSGSNYGIWVKSGSGSASLTIEEASVNANTTASYSNNHGVYVMSGTYATSSPALSLAVNGGSLTASGSASGKGIQFHAGAYEANSATTSLTVTGNAIVDARTGGISASGVNITPKLNIGGTGNSGGIVWNGPAGTVYGDVTLDEDLIVNEGETLTIPQGSTLNTNDNLTNNGAITVQNGGTINDADTIDNTGTINVENGGTMSGAPTGGTVVNAPAITTSLSNGTVGQYYSQTLLADGGGTITWGLADGSHLPDGLTLDTNTGVITGTPTTAGNFTFTVTAKNSAGEASKEYTLTIATVPVTNVTLDHTVLALFPGDTTTLTATVEPDTATDKTVTWNSDKPGIAKVDANGNVTAVAPGTATITATAGGKTATCTVTVTDRTYTVSANPKSLEFDTICPGDTKPAAKTVTITNTGNQIVEVTLPAATGYTITGDEGFTNGIASIEPEGTATFTVQPNDLTAGNHSETLTISWNNGSLSLPVGFTVGHELTGVAAKAPTCTEDGYEAYWKCERCNELFSDADGKTPIPAPPVIKATGHKWGEPAWTWDGTTATATFTCKNDNSHTQTVTATVTSTVKTDPTCTENGVTEYTATVKHDGTTYTDTKDVADIPATGHEWGEDGHCTICDAVKPGFTPEIIQGDEATWTKGDGQPLSFTSNAAYADFQEARVDGQTLDPVHYTVEQGSTIVTLKAAYLETLDPGEHTLDIVSSTGTATVTFTITAKETQQPADGTQTPTDTQQPAKPAGTDRTDRTPSKPAGSGEQLARTGSGTMPALLTFAILMAAGLILGTLTLRRSRR